MFQSYEDRSDPIAGRARLALLRAELAAAGLTGFIVPHADEHQSEYLPPSAERLAWLTGFSGSAGMAIVLDRMAAVFVDGRYTLQVRAQIDLESFTPEHLIETPPPKWLAGVAKAGDRIGYDPWLMTMAEMKRFEAALAGTGADLVAVAENPLDLVWTDRPSPPIGAVSLQPEALSGEATAAKLERLRAALGERRADAAVLTQADAIAWTFNIRGRDVAHNPAPLAFAILRREGPPSLYVDGRKLSNLVRSEVQAVADVAEPAAFAGGLAGLEGAKIVLDPQSTAVAIALAVQNAGGTIIEGADPTLLLKARKNPVEIDGARRAHVRDGAAVVRFLAWLDREAPGGGLDEIAAAETLERLRADTAARDGVELADISFDTISGAGPNGAVIHYRVNRATNRRIEPGSLFLIDSGGQYRDGTTDITRTVAVGAPTAEMRDRFTRVLKGHIALSAARFPAGTTGAQLDTLARLALWQAGLDYDHGTGHGVGSFLSVHEGPARIAKTGTVPLESGMILSNEPGYYKPGAFGIRIENLITVVPAAPIGGGERPMLAFETLTLAPIDLRLVEVALLSPDEQDWLDAYHRRVRATLLPLLADDAERDYLIAATVPLARPSP